MRRKVVKKYASLNLFFSTLAFIEAFQKGVDDYNKEQNKSTTKDAPSTAVAHATALDLNKK